MGYELYREVKVWAPESLTHREKLTAMVLADDANDRSRLTYTSVADPEIMRQAMVKNERDMRKILARLVEEKVIEHAGGGHNGRVAKYRFLVLAPAGTADTVAGPNRTGYEQEADDSPVQKEPATDGVGGSFWHRSRSKSNPPTPRPQTNPPPSPSAPPAQEPIPEPEAPTGREGGRELSPDEQTAIDTLAAAIANEPRLTLGEAELAALLPLVQPWLARASPEQLRTALTAGLPDRISAPAAFVRDRLRRKLPRARAAEPAPVTSSLPAWCEECNDRDPAARFNARLRLTPTGDPCPNCHPDAPAAQAA